MLIFENKIMQSDWHTDGYMPNMYLEHNHSLFVFRISTYFLNYINV